MIDLDQIDREVLDPGGMLDTVEDSGDQWADAISLSRGLPRDRNARRPAAVLVGGMGGSGIAGDVAALAADRSGTMPVVPVKGYELPNWAGADHLLVAVSYSGNTEETLSLVEDAGERGCRIAAVTSGGELAARAVELSWMVARIPGGQQPRASLPYLAAPTLGILVSSGALTPGVWDDIDALPDAVRSAAESWGGRRAVSLNAAKQAALALADVVPVFYGGRGVGALVAQRAKCQINENAGRPAFYSEVPERDHNEIVGWETAAAPLAPVELRSPADENPRVDARFGAAIDLVGEPVVRQLFDGTTWLERFAVGALFVDLVSVYVALLHGTDPTPVEPIEHLKQALAREAQDA
ncbi:MAG: SIS domain-containing protein [Nitriliruptorales bacterium]|nr:SIS domain-containing protein [Nitriliruptorales bacterium]